MPINEHILTNALSQLEEQIASDTRSLASIETELDALNLKIQPVYLELRELAVIEQAMRAMAQRKIDSGERAGRLGPPFRQAWPSGYEAIALWTHDGQFGGTAHMQLCHAMGSIFEKIRPSLNRARELQEKREQLAASVVSLNAAIEASKMAIVNLKEQNGVISPSV